MAAGPSAWSESWSAGLTRPNQARQQVAALAAEQVVLLAIGSGACVLVALSQPCEVLQMLGPEPDEVGCVGWCSQTKSLAAGAGAAIVVYNRAGAAAAGAAGGAPARRGDWHWEWDTRLPQPGVVVSLAWTRAAGASRALWVCAGCELALWSQPDDPSAGWSLSWRRALAQPAALLSARGAAGIPLLATAGAADRLAKVWYPQPADDPEADRPRGRRRAAPTAPASSFSFCYLPHPRALRSLEWRAPAGAALAGAADEASVLLTLCADGTPRLWLTTREGPTALPRFSLCASLSHDPAPALSALLADDTAVGGDARECRLVLWLLPSAARLFPSTPDPAAASPSPGGRSPFLPAPSPLLGFDAGIPTLRPSLRERHDYVLGLLADGSVVVWLVHALAAHPRCSPKVRRALTLTLHSQNARTPGPEH